MSEMRAGESGDQAVLPCRHPELLLWAVMAVTTCQFMDATIANVAIPHMQTSLGASADTISWVLTSFIIAGAITTPIIGWLSDQVGSRRLFLWSCVGFLITSGFCGVATNLPTMVIFRVLQGVTAAFMGPMSQAIMYDITKPSRQPRALSIWGVVVMIAPIIGPFIGGFLTDSLNWRWVFFVNLPIGIPALIIVWWLLPSRPIEHRRLDIFGFAMLGLALGAFQLALDRGQSKDWLQSWEIIVELALGISCFWMFVVHSRMTTQPLFSGRLLGDANFIASLALMTATGLANVGLLAVLPTMYQNVYGYSVMDTGLLMAPRGIGVVITMLMTNTLIRAMDYRYVAVIGFVIAAYAMWTMTQWSIDQAEEMIIWSSFIQGLGLGLVFVPMNLIGFSRLPIAYRMEGSALMSLMRSLGGSVGISAITTMLARNLQTSHSDLSGAITSFSLPSVDLSAVTDRLGSAGGGVMAMVDGLVNQQAAMIAYLDNFYMMFWVMLVIAPLPLIATRPSKATTGRPEPMALE